MHDQHWPWPSWLTPSHTALAYWEEFFFSISMSKFAGHPVPSLKLHRVNFWIARIIHNSVLCFFIYPNIRKTCSRCPLCRRAHETKALKPQDKYLLYLTPQSTRGLQLVIGSMMCCGDSTPVTHQALACVTPALASQPWPAASSFITYWPSDTLPHLFNCCPHILGGTK